MEILGLIPARGGSKGLPHKNITPLAGRPLLAYTAQAALQSRRLTRVILSTDDPLIADVGKQLGLSAPFLRPAGISRDGTPMLDVILHALDYLKRADAFSPGIIVLLQPTSPLRTSDHVDRAVDLLLSTDADTVVSVVAVPHQFNPVSVMRIEGERLVAFLEGPLILRRQDKPMVFARNGPAIIATRSIAIEMGRLYGENTRPLIMSHPESVDIDTEEDLAFAEFLIRRNTLFNSTNA